MQEARAIERARGAGSRGPLRISLPHNWEPRPYQRGVMRWFDGGGKRAACVWHRRAGKDLTALHQLAKAAFERRGAYWHCLPTYSQAKKAIWDGFSRDGQRIIEAVFPPSVVKRKNESEMLVELVNGSIVQLVGSDTVDRLVGAGPVGITFSEFALSKPNAWDLVRPMLAENGGWASFIFTPRGPNHAKKLYDFARTRPDWFCEKLTIHDTQALPASILDEERAAGMPEALIRQEYLCDFTAALVGSVYGDVLEQLEARGGVDAFEHERDAVFTSWDLGFTDSTAIWFWRLGNDGVDFVDHYEAHGKPLSHFFDVLQAKSELLGYQYLKHWLPHDARAHTLASGTSIQEQCIARWGAASVAIGPQLSLLDGVQAARWLLQRNTRFHARCLDGIEALKAYAYEWDEDKRTFGKKPEHSWASHTADALRYAAVVVRVSELLRPEKPRAKVVPIRPQPVTLDALYALQAKRNPRGRI